jgi:hypothetical protein
MNTLADQQVLEDEHNYWVEMYSALEQLKENKHFQKLILDGYFTDRAVNAVSMLANDSVVREGRRSEIMEDLIGISSLQDHFIMIQNLGSVTPDDDEDF